jgi:hypothetical protein
VLLNPSFFGYGAIQAYLPSEDLAIAASATLDEDAEVGLNGGQKVFEEIAAVLAPDIRPSPDENRRKQGPCDYLTNSRQSP